MRQPSAIIKQSGMGAIHSEEIHRLIELGRLSASLLHEISNPLTSALLHIEQHVDQKSRSIKEARRSIRLLRRYVEAARQQVRNQSAQTSFSLKAQFGQLKRLVQPVAITAGVKLKIGPLPDCRLVGDPVKFQQILANLMINAVEAYSGDVAPSPDKDVCIEVIHTETTVMINILDRGRGIGPAGMPSIFEPFYTTKAPSSHGLGIGLAIVKQYVTSDFGGTIRVSSSRRNGTVFSIKLPAVAK